MRYSSLVRACLVLSVGAAPALFAQIPTFSAPKQIPSSLPSGYSSTVFLAGNFNGNGNTDLIVTTSNSIYGPFTQEFLNGNGSGAFTQTGTVTSLPATYNQALVADVNGDGKDDIITLMGGCEELPCNNWPDEGDADGVFTVMLSQGNGQFTQGYVGTLPSGLAGVDGVIGDFNKDGKPDVAVLSTSEDGQNSPELAIFLNNGDGTFTQTDYQTPAVLSYGMDNTNLVVGDFEGNGNQDLAFAFSGIPGSGSPAPAYPTIMTFAGDGKGDFGPGVISYTFTGYSFAGPPANWALFASDLNGEGRADLAITLYGAGSKYSTITLLTDSQGRFHWGSAVTLSASGPLTLLSDVNGDGHPDLIYLAPGSSGSTTENAGIYLGTASGAFKTPHIALSVPGTGDQLSMIAVPLKKGALPSLFVSGAKSVALEFINTTK